MEQYRLCWPEEPDGRGMLLLVAVEPGAERQGNAVPCRVVGTLSPGDGALFGQRTEPPARSAAEAASRLLVHIGVPTNLLGYAYLRTALLLAVEQPELLRGLNRALYPEVARRHGTQARCVERAIRHAIGQTWARGGGERCRQLMGREASCVGDRPTNGEFIALLADRLSLERGRDCFR